MCKLHILTKRTIIMAKQLIVTELQAQTQINNKRKFMQNKEMKYESNTKPRIEYIDAMRGFTMIMVVLYHIKLNNFSGPADNTIFTSILMSFRMPLFFFISGFLTYKYNTCIQSHSSLIANSLKKIRIQVIPTLIIGLTYTYIIANKNWHDFIANDLKLGYWFTIALLEMFLIYYLVCFLTKKWTIKENFTPLIIVLVGTSLCMYLALSPIKRFPMLNSWCDAISFTRTCQYFIYFVAGIIASKYRNIFFLAQRNQYISAIAIVSFTLLTYYNFTIVDYDSYAIEKFFTRISPVILGLLGIFIVFNFFRTYQENFTRERKLGRILQFIGKRTLDIYLLHYFLIPTIPYFGDFIQDNPNFVIEATVLSLLSILVVAFCLVLSSIIRTSSFLGYYLFGVKQK